LVTARENGHIMIVSLAGERCRLALASHIDSINSKRLSSSSSHGSLRKLKGLAKTWPLLYIRGALRSVLVTLETSSQKDSPGK